MKKLIKELIWRCYLKHKPHIVQFRDGTYAVRMYGYEGWRYLDAKDAMNWWSSPETGKRRGSVNSFDQATAVLNAYTRGTDFGTLVDKP